MKKSLLNWSSGKDAAFALFELQKKKEFSVEKLVTTINTETNRVSMHGLHKMLLENQAAAVGIPLHIIPLGGNVSMAEYNSKIARENEVFAEQGFTHSIFGDIFLEDLREYREQQLSTFDLHPVFPLWKRNTSKLIRDFISKGFKAITVSTNASVLDGSFCGRIIDENFLKELPEGVDPCGENGEFHTFVFDGPIFQHPVNFRKGEMVQRQYSSAGKDDDDCFSDKKQSWDTNFWYIDLLPQ